MFPLRACCSWLRFFRGGAQTTRTGSGCFLWTGQPADCEGHLQPFLRKSPETADVREGPQDYVRTEPGLHNGELVNDFRVSPTDEDVGVVEEDELSRAARRPRTGANGSPQSPRRTAGNWRRWSQNCGGRASNAHCAERGCSADSLWVHLGSVSCQKKCVKKCHCVTKGETTLHPKNTVPRDNNV